MCVAAFGKVIELKGKNAVVSFRGVTMEVSIALVPGVEAGESVVVHAGFATEIVKDTQKFFQDIVSTDAYAAHLLDAIKRESGKFGGQQFKIMNFCGTHENTIVQYGLRELLPSCIQLVSGPGCPVCVTPEEEIAKGIEIAKREDVILTTYGDLMRVPTKWGSLEQVRMNGADIRIIYNISQALELARATKKEVVHFAVGFETTAPSTAAVLQEAGNKNNFSILSSHRITPPAMEYVLLNSEVNAILCPGHVAMVIGTKPFDVLSRKCKIPCVIGGFEPVDILESVLMMLQRLDDNDCSAANQYCRVVEDEGNTVAQGLINKTFRLKDANWRGVGPLSQSRLVLKDEYSIFDAEQKFSIQLPVETDYANQSCICSDILKGKSPKTCPNFMKCCSPENPLGPCMISREGACNIAYLNN